MNLVTLLPAKPPIGTSSPVTKKMYVPGLDGSVRDLVYRHVFENADREVGGVLVGQIGRLGGVPLVTAAIPAQRAGERLATLTFTQDTWEHVHKVMQRDHPDDQIVGWYHSHPGFGIFLSEHDLFIHRHFFSGSSQIALVVDPLAGTEGVFGWSDGEIARWYERPTIRPGLGTRPSLELSAASLAPPARPPAVAIAPDALPRGVERPPSWTLAAVLLAGVLLGFLLWEGVLRDGGASTAQTSTNPPSTVRLAPQAGDVPAIRPGHR